jgi:hypothetical protein
VVVNLPGWATFSAWSPAGDRLAFVSAGDVWMVASPGCPPRGGEVSNPTRVTDGAEARDLAWVEDGTALLVSGTWGGDSLDIRRVMVGDPTLVPETVLVIGDPRGEGTFGVSRDGRYVSTIATHTRGDIWVARVVDL